MMDKKSGAESNIGSETEISRLNYLMAAKDGNLIAGVQRLRAYRDQVYKNGYNTTELNVILGHFENALKINGQW